MGAKMSEIEVRKPATPWTLITLTTLLTLLTLAGAGAIAYGFYTGELVPYWNGLSDAHASIFAQLIFFLAAAWASVLVPLLFREQLQNVQDAAKRAEAICKAIESRMEKAATESETQFKNMVRLQMMSVGHLMDEQLEYLKTPEDMKLFVDTRWDKAETKINAAIRRANGHQRNSINAQTKRSPDWWDKLRGYGTLGDYHDDFRVVSDKARKRKQDLNPEDLREVNNASRSIENFDPAGSAAAPLAVSPPTFASPPNGMEPPAQSLPQ